MRVIVGGLEGLSDGAPCVCACGGLVGVMSELLRGLRCWSRGVSRGWVRVAVGWWCVGGGEGECGGECVSAGVGRECGCAGVGLGV